MGSSGSREQDEQGAANERRRVDADATARADAAANEVNRQASKRRSQEQALENEARHRASEQDEADRRAARNERPI